MKKRRNLRSMTPDIRRSVLIEDDYTCIYCGEKTKNPHVDHIVPIALGGNSDNCNLATACQRCNYQKGEKTYHEWMVSWVKKAKEISSLPKRKDIFEMHERWRGRY
jgi:5-methylcytosine-specific restriction endonuclease McrA